VINVTTSSLLERYQRLVEISRDLASTLDLNTLLNRIVQAAADLSGSEAASILLYDEANQQLYFEAASNLEQPLMRGLIVPVDSSIAGLIVTEREPIIIKDTQNDPRHFDKIGKATKVQTTSLLGVPLITKDKVVGALEAINKLSGEFTEEDQNMLLALGAQAAVAIENSRLFQQSDLISEIVHELRTPLSSLNAAAHLLQRPEISSEQRNKMVQTIYRETRRLSEMTSAFLDLARLESGRAQFCVELINLKELLEETATIMRGRALEKGQELLLELKTLPSIQGDADKLKQMFLNLLSNAIKYTQSGGKIYLSGWTDRDEAVIRVRDTGLGISKDYLPHIFEKFYRVPGSENTATGTGLGLSICKRIVDAHGAAIEVDSVLGEGTTFTVRLPTVEPDQET
jgi:signal transduction histidine kinase